jgi:hypothetical protein
VSFVELENSIQEAILKVIPTFYIKDYSLVIFQEWNRYLYGIFILSSLAIVIDLYKDCG